LRSQNTATVTEQDRLRLEEMARSLHTVGDPFRCHLRELEDRLRDAAIVPPARLDPGVISMNSDVRLEDLDSGRRQTLTLAYHGTSEVFDSRLSVLTPLGVKLLGARVGDVIGWPVPCNVRRVKVKEILYQPEAAGDFNL
jgi:regulator of nucleoside diphosphate kinase